MTYVFTRGYNLGIVEVTLDGVTERIDLYAPDILWQQERTWTLAPGQHDLTLRVLAERHPESEGYYVDLDGFVVR